MRASRSLLGCCPLGLLDLFPCFSDRHFLTRQRDIASKGGKAAHQKRTAHEWSREEAREAGRKGGMASHRRKQEQQTPGAALAGSVLERL